MYDCLCHYQKSFAARNGSALTSMSTPPQITGVICTHNRERYLERCILSLLHQSLDEKDYEILVVDNGSTDKTRYICDKFKGEKKFRYVFEPVLGLSSARNRGWQAAKGRYVGYLDDDAVADRTWFESALKCFENIKPQPEWVGGPIELEWEKNGPDWITEDLLVALGKVDWGTQERFLTEPWERLGGGNSFYVKSVLEKMGGFDNRLGRKKKLLLSGEETQFQHRIRAIGGRLYYHPGVRIFHYVPIERMEPMFFYRRYYWGGVTDYIISKTLVGTNYTPIDEQKEQSSFVYRLISNALSATGLLGSKGAAIKSRIYFSYLLGWAVAVLKHGRRKF